MGNPFIHERGPRVRVIASPAVWIEGEALRQLDEASKLPGMAMTVGLPDLHPGKGGPVGAAFACEGLVYPSLVGSDIGCGMGLWSTDLTASKAKPDKIATKMNGLDGRWDGCVAEFAAEFGLESTPFDQSLGTPGFGNHFVEIQVIHEVRDPGALAEVGIDGKMLCILVHSGSRGFGESVLRKAVVDTGRTGLAVGSPEAGNYLVEHDKAIKWAEANRALCASRVADALRAESKRVLDVCHNSVLESTYEGKSVWLHRKGAASAECGPIVIPGSRGDYSYLVIPLDCGDSLMSLAHGAGRKMSRHEAAVKSKDRFGRDGLLTNPWGGRVVCGDTTMAQEEAPLAYKDIGTVVDALAEAGLIRIVAALRPVVTFKSSESPKQVLAANEKGSWRAGRKAAAAEKRRLS